MEAAAAYRAARRLARGRRRCPRARLDLKLARVQGWLDRYATLCAGSPRDSALEGEHGDDAARQRAELLAWYGRCCQEKDGTTAGPSSGARSQSRRPRQPATKRPSPTPSGSWTGAKMELGQLEEPDNWVRALALFEELDNLPGQAGVLNMLGMFAYFRGEWEQGSRRCTYVPRRRCDRTGNAVMDAIYVSNIGEIALDQGRLEDAERHFENASRVVRAARYRAGTAYVNINLARLAARQGRYGDSLRIFEESIAESRDVGAGEKLLEAQARKAECLMLSGEVTGALSLAEEALLHARTLGGVPAQIPLLQRVRGAALARTGDRAAAAEALEQSLLAARERGAEYEVALSSLVMAQVRADTNPAESEQLRLAAEATLAKLGVVSTPDLLSS